MPDELRHRTLQGAAPVSYTHLDVYKRQVYPLYTQINYKGTPVRVVPLQYSNIIKWLTNRTEGLPGYIAVSYTHLDVYKRQYILPAFRHFLFI